MRWAFLKGNGRSCMSLKYVMTTEMHLSSCLSLSSVFVRQKHTLIFTNTYLCNYHCYRFRKWLILQKFKRFNDVCRSSFRFALFKLSNLQYMSVMYVVHCVCMYDGHVVHACMYAKMCKWRDKNSQIYILISFKYFRFCFHNVLTFGF